MWGDNGGILTAHAQADGVPRVHGKLASPQLSKANRVAIHEKSGLVLLPLEQTVAKLALINISNASEPRLAGPIATLPRGVDDQRPVQATTYCGAFTASGEHVYAFAAQTNTM